MLHCFSFQSRYLSFEIFWYLKVVYSNDDLNHILSH